VTRDHYDVDVGIGGALRARLCVTPAESESGVAVVEHELPPNTLAAPLHRHRHEDELSVVVTGEMGVQAGDEVTTVGAGEVVAKERGRWHTFWSGDGGMRCFEVIAPGEFAGYFADVAGLLPSDDPDDPEAAAAERAAIRERYGLELDPESVPDLLERHGLAVPDALEG